MSKFFTAFSILALVVMGGTSCCKKTLGAAKPERPACFEKLIADAGNTVCPQGAALKQYTFDGKTVFVLEPGNCGADMAAPVYDTKCALLGYLGGFAGNTKIEGKSFSTAEYVKTVWHN